MEVMTSRNLGQLLIEDAGLKTLTTAPANTTLILKELLICNQGAADAEITVSAVPGGATPGPVHVFLYRLSVLAGETRTVADCSTVLEAGWRLMAQSVGAPTLSLLASGIRIEVTA